MESNQYVAGEPVVSIIIPAYNAEKTIERCLDSIVSQTMSDWEVIIIDDGSVDNTTHICMMWAQKESRIKFIKTTNCGVSAARNTGLNIATGKYVLFVDSDDSIMPEYLRRAVERIGDNDVVLSGITKIEEAEIQEILPWNIEEQSNLGFWEQLYCLQEETGLVGYVSNKLYRRSLLETYCLRFDVNKNVQEDLAFALSVFKHTCALAILSESYYKYYHTNKTANACARFGIIDNMLCFYDVMRCENIGDTEGMLRAGENIITELYLAFYWCDAYRQIRHYLKSLYLDKRFELMLRNRYECSGVKEVMFIFLKYKIGWGAFAIVRCRRKCATVWKDFRRR